MLNKSIHCGDSDQCQPQSYIRYFFTGQKLQSCGGRFLGQAFSRRRHRGGFRWTQLFYSGNRSRLHPSTRDCRKES